MLPQWNDYLSILPGLFMGVGWSYLGIKIYEWWKKKKGPA